MDAEHAHHDLPSVGFSRRLRRPFGTVLVLTGSVNTGSVKTVLVKTVLVKTVMILGLCLLIACRKPPATGADIAVTIDGEEIHYSDFESYLRGSSDDADSSLVSEVQSQLFDQFLDAQLLIRLATERGLVRPDVDQRLAMQFLLREDPSRAFSMEDLKAYYDAQQADFRRPEEVQLRQILVQDREVAEQAHQAIEAGEDFVEVAARFSQEPRAHLGGDQGRLAREDLPAPYVDTIFDLATGEVSDIISADYGFHIFQVVEHFPAEIAPFEEVTAEIRSTLNRIYLDDLVDGFISDARERYNVKIFPANFPFDYQGYYAHHHTPPGTQ